MALEKARGIVIKSTSLNDNDVILTIFSKERGKFQAVAKGAKKTKSQFIGSTQLFCYTDFVYYRGKGLDYVNQTELIESFYKIRNDLETLAIATYIVEIVLHSLDKEQQEERLFNLLVYCLNLINKELKQPKLLLLAYQLKVIGLLGYAPDFEQCSKCHNNIQKYYFSKEIGGLICSNCKGKYYPYSNPISIRALELMKELLHCQIQQINKIQSEDQIINYLVHIMNDYIVYHTDRKLFSFDFLETI